MSERVRHTNDTADDTATATNTTNTAKTTPDDGQRWDLGTLFPAKGDPRRPPEWMGRALLYIAIAIVVFSFCWRSWGQIAYLVMDIVISLFLALAVEPVVMPLVKHGWKRAFASLFALVLLAVILCTLLGLFGNMFVQQVIAMINGLPDLYKQICDFVSQYTNFELPEINSLGSEILKNIQTSWVTDFAGTALSTVSGLFSFLLNLMTIVMTTYYISAAGPKLRRAACQWMAPAAQRRFLFVWTVSQGQISSFLFSRALLALLNAVFTAICLEVLHVPYWLPLALFCGVTSQFIPMLGTYIGGALPVLFAWGNRGIWYGIAVLAFICVYQQIENLIFAPKISQRTMNINDAVAFLAVLAFGSLFGALGAFLALPVTASIQTIFRTYTKRYDLVDSPLMNDPVPERKSKVVEGAEAISERVLHHIPRAVQGSTANVPISDEVRQLQEQAYNISPSGGSDDADDSQTLAIPKNALSARGNNPLKGTQDADETQSGETPDPETHDASDDNPRSRWR
ncbi:AI-2E family transporter [Bifidobacterium moukalabense]|uniref:Membrane protein n=1 Tax=Bifidobacterium moukalabense DSM 27321 TaxID=1435051 RepID=W4N7D8_9BIFI|nr:AI-2E family transporter [Bifidobacterium moukalabense]ETY70949.1 membrane protein [Bifidobacterium moukalabense DSM 27321]